MDINRLDEIQELKNKCEDLRSEALAWHAIAEDLRDQLKDAAVWLRRAMVLADVQCVSQKSEVERIRVAVENLENTVRAGKND